jgi:hypothetical protein
VLEPHHEICKFDPKTLNHYQNAKSTYQNENVLNKNRFSTLKVQRSQKFRMGATRRNLQAQPKILKITIGTPNQLIRTKNLQKKSIFST